MHLYHVTVQRPSTINDSVVCRFGSNECLVLARGQWLEVIEFKNDETVLRCRANLLASIRCIRRVNTSNSSNDTLALTSDSGEFVLLAYDYERSRFSRVALASMGRSGFRRTIPGEYLAVDPKGRAALVAGIEKHKTVFVLHPDGVSSPIEANASSTYCYDLVALDRGYANPAFASLERFRYGKKMVVLYELNLGLNHLVKIWSRPVAEETDVLLPVPGGRNGPSGLIIISGCTAMYLEPTEGDIRHEVALPQPVVCGTVVQVRRGAFLLIVQTLDGACLNLKLNDESLSFTVVGRLPRSTSLNVMESGHIFANTEWGDDAVAHLTSFDPLQLNDVLTMASLSPCIATLFQRKQIVTLSTTGLGSRLSVLEYSKDIEELVSSPLPGIPSAIFATKNSKTETGHRLIALAFKDKTTTLAVADDGSVNEVSEADTGLTSHVQTLGLHFVGDGLVQVHPSGFRYVSQTPVPWLAPKGQVIVGCSFTPSQMLLMLNGNKLLYFEFRNGMLVESQHKVSLPSRPSASCFRTLPQHELFSPFFYVACEDETVRMFSVPDLKQQKLYNSTAPVTSMQYTDTLHLGHANGLYSRLHDDQFWSKVIGGSPVQLVLASNNSILALTSRTWMISGTDATPLGGSASNLLAAHSFVTEDLPDGILGIGGSSLQVFRILSISDGMKTTMHDIELPCSITRLSRNTFSDYLYGCGQHSVCVIGRGEEAKVSPFTSPLNSPGLLCANVRFDSRKDEFLVVATKSGIMIYEYLGQPKGRQLQLLHETPVRHCSAILPFRGMLLASINKTTLVLYDLGQKQLLKNASIDLPDLTGIKVLRAARNRVYVGDSRLSVTVLSYESPHFAVLFADPIPRSVTSMVLLDHASVCIGDQYGNVSVLRCPDAQAPVARDQDRTQLETLARFWVPDGIVDLHRGVLSPIAGVEAIVYVGIQGTVGALIPFASAEDLSFFSELELEVGRRITALAGRNATAFRGYYTPVKNVVDGDLCEHALCSAQGLSHAEIEEIAASMEIDTSDVLRRVITFRERSVF